MWKAETSHRHTPPPWRSSFEDMDGDEVEVEVEVEVAEETEAPEPPEPPWRPWRPSARQKETRQARPTAKTANTATGQRSTTNRAEGSLAKRSAELDQRDLAKVTQDESVAKTKGGQGKSRPSATTKSVKSARGGVLMGAQIAAGASHCGKGTFGTFPGARANDGNGEANMSKEEPTKPEAGKGQRLRLPRPKFPKPKASEPLQVRLPEVQPTPKRRLAPKVPKEAPKELPEEPEKPEKPEQPEKTEKPETSAETELGDLADQWNADNEETTAAMDHTFDMEAAFQDPIEDHPIEEEPLILPKRTSLIAELLTDFGCFKQRKC